MENGSTVCEHPVARDELGSDSEEMTVRLGNRVMRLPCNGAEFPVNGVRRYCWSAPVMSVVNSSNAPLHNNRTDLRHERCMSLRWAALRLRPTLNALLLYSSSRTEAAKLTHRNQPTSHV